MKAVECTRQSDPPETLFSSNTVKVRLHMYQMYTTRENYETVEQADVSSMPHADFDGQWDE
jgi:hypothetical protein